MINQNTRRGETQEKNKNCHSRGFLSRMIPSFTTLRGFTLIELLVVVLIIGLLAAVALPQYQKAVRKARMAEVAQLFDSLSHAIDMWLLENDNIEYITFVGTQANATLPIDIPCERTNSVNGCSYKGGAMTVTPTSIGLGATSNFNVSLNWTKPSRTSPWTLGSVFTTDEQLRKLVCQWWIENYGVDLLVGTARDEQCQ